MKATISVIVPIYNAEQYLAQCIHSLINQTYRELQIILIDDGSTDNSLSIAQDAAKQDSRIEVHTKSNQGLSATRNFGLLYAHGIYISFVDADDCLDLDFYDTLIQQANNVDYVQFGYKRVTDNGVLLHQKKPANKYQLVSACMRLYRKAIFDQYTIRFQEGIIYEDVLFSVDLWNLPLACKLLPYCGYNYIQHVESITSKRNIKAEKILFSSLNERMKKANGLRQFAIILYTIIRLKFHFLRYE